MVRETAQMSTAQNRPRLQDRPVRTLDYLEDIISGFTTTYRFLVAHREDWLALLPRFAHDRIRFLPRQSQRYELIRTESFYPNLLRDALRRERFFDRLWLGVAEQPALASLIPAERADLLRGDIPMFTTFPDSCDLYTGQGERIPDVFATSSMNNVIARVRQMNEQDLQRQCWIIRASFASLPEVGNSVNPPRSHPSIYPPVPDDDLRTRCITAATAIREQLRKEAIISNNRAAWLTVSEGKGHSWSIVPTNTSLHYGTAGILLFLAYLDTIEGGKRDVLTELTFNALQTEIAHIKQDTPDKMDNMIGGFVGLGSSIYLLSHLGILWQDATFLTAAEEIVALLPRLIEQDRRFDIIGGAAGCLMSLISLYDAAPSAHTLEAARHCGNHLIAHACLMHEGMSLGWRTLPSTPPLSGFSHGAAGIATSLFQLAAHCGETRFFNAALKAINYERTLFSPVHNNWLDRPVLSPRSSNGPTEDAKICKTAWSYGAPGIGLARLTCLPYIDDQATRDEIASALTTTMAQGFGCKHAALGSNHSLCHGDFGNLETLLVAAQILHEPAYQEQVNQRAAQLLDDGDKNGWISGVPLNIVVPGLMTGLAGIGYELLRIAEPERVPSVLSLAAPYSSREIERNEYAQTHHLS
jgi:type 2 lantibiotic biosynthesis protein LanM